MSLSLMMSIRRYPTQAATMKMDANSSTIMPAANPIWLSIDLTSSLSYAKQRHSKMMSNSYKQTQA